MTQPTHVIPDHSRQRHVWFGDTLTQGYVVSGGAFTVPGGGGTTLGAQPCEAYGYDSTTGELLYCGQPSSAVGPLTGGAGTYWVAIHKNPSSAVPGWTRHPGTRYLWKLSATLPAVPDASQLLAQVTVAGGNITAVKDQRIPASFARYGVFDVTDPLYGAVPSPDHTVSSLTGIRLALARSNQIHFPEGVYWLGDMNPGDIAFDLSTLGAGVAIGTEGIVQLVCHTTSTGIPILFELRNNPGFHCGPVSFEDTGYDPLVTWRGATAFHITNPAGADDWHGLDFESITCFQMVSALTILQTAPLSTANRVRGIHIGAMHLDTCYYGLNCINEGDDLTINLLSATKTIRTYFVYGVSGHSANIFTRRNWPSSGNVNISRGVGGLDTTGIQIHYTAYEDDLVYYTGSHISINHIDLLGGEISGLDLTVDIKAPNGIEYNSVRFVNYTGSGGSETLNASLNHVRDIRLAGTCDAAGDYIDTYASYADKGQMTFHTGLNFFPTRRTLSKFQLTQQAKNVTSMRWTASGDDPVLGDGTLVYSLDVVQGMANLQMIFFAGATTTFGTGEWQFDNFLLLNDYMDVTSTAIGSWMAKDDSTSTYYTGTCRSVGGGPATVFCFVAGATEALGAAIPFTWAQDDELYLQLMLPISG